MHFSETVRALKNLNITKSIELRKLVFKESWYDRFDTLTIYFMCLAIISFAILCFAELKSFSENKFEYFILSCLIIFSLYTSYCKFTEKKLKRINFNIHKEEAKKRIMEYGKKYNYRISKVSSNLIFLNEPTNNFDLQENEQTTIVFFKDNEVLYTVIKEESRINFPVLFSQHFTKIELKKILNQTNVKTKKSYFSRFFNELS